MGESPYVDADDRLLECEEVESLSALVKDQAHRLKELADADEAREATAAVRRGEYNDLAKATEDAANFPLGVPGQTSWEGWAKAARAWWFTAKSQHRQAEWAAVSRRYLDGSRTQGVDERQQTALAVVGRLMADLRDEKPLAEIVKVLQICAPSRYHLALVCQEIAATIGPLQSPSKPFSWEPGPKGAPQPNEQATSPPATETAPSEIDDARPDAPPVKGWQIEPGRYFFRGREFELAGKPLDLLAEFLRSFDGGYLDYKHLKATVWDGSLTGEDAIRSTVAALRLSLKEVTGRFQLDIPDPLPQKRTAGWKFNMPRE